jgi:tRNA A37 threonylcarbamoyladenosine synthetase subunit TsaC/SUA5/YrdC
MMRVPIESLCSLLGAPLIGIRIPDYPFIREVCRQVATPLALTSANISSTGLVY